MLYSCFIDSHICGDDKLYSHICRQIKTSSPLKPFGVIYDYSEIEKINVGLNKGNYDSYSPFYEIILNDGTTVDFIGGVNRNIDTEDVLFNFENYV